MRGESFLVSGMGGDPKTRLFPSLSLSLLALPVFPNPCHPHVPFVRDVRVPEVDAEVVCADICRTVAVHRQTVNVVRVGVGVGTPRVRRHDRVRVDQLRYLPGKGFRFQEQGFGC